MIFFKKYLIVQHKSGIIIFIIKNTLLVFYIQIYLFLPMACWFCLAVQPVLAQYSSSISRRALYGCGQTTRHIMIDKIKKQKKLTRITSTTRRLPGFCSVLTVRWVHFLRTTILDYFACHIVSGFCASTLRLHYVKRCAIIW